MIGVAAHITAASPGGKRYDASMTREERRDISNGIWLCADHAALIDRDDVRYTVERLLQIKQAHEKWRIQELAGHGIAGLEQSDLIAIGVDIVGYGQLTSIEQAAWSVRLTHFVAGDTHAIVSFIDTFKDRSAEHRYILADSLGDGRLLVAPPTLKFVDGGCEVRCGIDAAFPRIRAQDLGADIALVDGDLAVENGSLRMVSGVDALEQKIRLSLSLQRGDLPFNPGYGARLLEYYRDFKGSPWLERLLKLEVIRLAAIPYFDAITRSRYTPLQCVDRVLEVAVGMPEDPQTELPIRVDLEVQGVGRVTQTVPIRMQC